MKAAIIGGGVIGGGWAARFLLNGWDVDIFDLDPEAERKITEVLANARSALPMLYDCPLPKEGKLNFVPSIKEAVKDAKWVQESVPENLDIKHSVHAEITKHAAPDALIGSSTSGFKPSQLAQKGARVFVAHPFNPVYLLPLIELVGAPDGAAPILEGLGFFPLALKREIEGHIADRLLEAVWREALWLVHDEIATTKEIDEAIRMGFGLRWAQMGLFETYRIAGGEAGMKHFLEQFGPALKWPWTKLMDVPEMTGEFAAQIADQSDAQSGAHSIRELERARDQNLVGILRLLKERNWGAGKVVGEYEKGLGVQGGNAAGAEAGGAYLTPAQVLPGWIDYNGHMSEKYYSALFADASDVLLHAASKGGDAPGANGGYFTLESHVAFISELHLGEKIAVKTQALFMDERKLHLFHTLHGSDERVAAIGEQFLIHMDLEARKPAPAPQKMREYLGRFLCADGWPEGAGKVGRKSTA